MELSALQKAHKAWIDDNFPGRDHYYHILGAIEELGELAHAELKLLEAIRGGPEGHTAKARDAIGDVIFFLMGYASDHGWSMEEILAEVWAEVSQRNWRRFPVNGRDR